MKQIAIGITFIVLTGPFAYAQRTTEMFIPIGQSPGVSGKQTFLGKIDRVDAKARWFSVTTSERSYKVKVTNQTRIWLDRTLLKLSNQDGTFADCRKDLTAEIKMVGVERTDNGVADWIKIRVDGASSASE
jgi:hypothetical protein